MCTHFRRTWCVNLRCLACCWALPRSRAVVRSKDSSGIRVATGQHITPYAVPGAQVQKLHTDFRSDDSADGSNGVTTALSPDGKTLLILTTGFQLRLQQGRRHASGISRPGSDHRAAHGSYHFKRRVGLRV